MRVVRRIKRRKLRKGKDFRVFTPRARRIIYAGLRAGLSCDRVCDVVGIKRSVFTQWLKLGREEGPESAYYQFLQYVRRIEAQKEKDLLNAIDRVAVGNFRIRETEVSISSKGRFFKRKTKTALPNWKAAAWRLERKWKKEYAPLMPNETAQSSPEEIAQDIYDATMQLRNSIPMEEE
jgi:hypothetical protein